MYVCTHLIKICLPHLFMKKFYFGKTIAITLEKYCTCIFYSHSDAKYFTPLSLHIQTVSHPKKSLVNPFTQIFT